MRMETEAVNFHIILYLKNLDQLTKTSDMQLQ